MANKNENPPNLTTLLDAFKAEIFGDMNCVQIGEIVSFSPISQTAQIRLAIKHVVSVAPDGTRTLKERPVLGLCPVHVLTGGLGRVTVPVSAGDTCIVLFNDREIDNWLTNGGVQDPTTDRMHDMSDALALVGIRNTRNAVQDYRMDGVEIAYAGNSLVVGEVNTSTDGALNAGSLHAANGITGIFSRVLYQDGIAVQGIS